MKNKLRLAFPLCLVLAALVVALFCITSFAASDEGSSSVTVENMNAQGIDAPAKSLETVAPLPSATSQVTETDENAEDSVIVSEDQDSGYTLTDEERIAVECAVMSEAGGESLRGQMMVAQSILDGTLRNDFDIFETLDKYQIATTYYSCVTDSVKESVSRVFDDGERVTEEKADLWYNPALVASPWHESQQYVITIGMHRFFWMNQDMDT